MPKRRVCGLFWTGTGPIDPDERGAVYRREGWSGTFDPKAPAYRPNDAEIERIRRDWAA
jgi:hypothetical protein